MSDRATVFVVDDDRAVLDSLSLMLTDEGYAVRSYECAETLLAEIETDERTCVIADMQMPGFSGLDLLAALQQQSASVPVIVLTGHANVPLAVEAIRRGAVDLFEKPFKSDALLTSIHEALKRKDEEALEVEARNEAKEWLATLTPIEPLSKHEVAA